MKIAVFIMNEEYNDYLEIDEIRNDYFNCQLKENGGKYYCTNKKYSIALNCDAVLFKYKGMYIAQAEKCIKFERGKKSIKNLESYYEFNPEKIKLNPLIKVDMLEPLFEAKNEGQNYVIEKQVKKDKEAEIKDFLELYKQPFLESKKWNSFANELKLNNLLKEINLYNFENIHTSFFSNFIKEDNIYNLGNKPLKLFLNLLKEKDKNFPDIDIGKFNVYYQKRYKIGQKNSIIPDITVDINDKNNKEKYRIIIEAKVTAEENIYKDNISEQEIKQCQKYREFFEKKKNEGNTEYKYIYVYLSFKKQNVDNYINITFKDIANKIYDFNQYDNLKNKDILKDYLKTFHDLCDSKYKFDIATIPDVYWNSEENLKKIYEEIKPDIENISKYKKSR